LDPPLGLLLIASYLRMTIPDVEVVVNDLSGIDESDWRIGEADIYGITVYITSLRSMEIIAKLCKKKNPESLVVIGGAHPSCLPASLEFINNPAINYVVEGEGELPMANIVKNRLKGRLTPVVDGKIISATFEPFDYSLFPSFDLIDIDSYHRRIGSKPSLPLLSSRGCVFSCAFCGLKKMHELGRGVRFVDPFTVVEHIKKIQKRFNILAINIEDDQFTFNRDRLFRILDLITPLNIKFRCHGRAGYDTEEVYRRLAEAGCVQVSWGIESGSNYLLDKMNKRSTVKENFDVIQWAKKYGIVSRAFFILGFPGETKDTLDETKKFIMEADPDQVFISNFVPYPGTDVWNFPEKYGVTKLYTDFNEYYQVGADGAGGLSVDTQWLSRQEFRDLELEFRLWIKNNKEIRGDLLDYEKRIYKNIKK